jgi:GMP synthase-like glutamine amidotransferase
LLAQALGGKVEQSPHGWGVGVRDYEVMVSKPWMTPAQSNVALIGSHQDQVTVMPAEAELLFRSDYCPNGGLAVGERAWTIQVHPEFTPEVTDHLLGGRIELIGAERVAAARASLNRPLDRHLLAQWMASSFAMAALRS